MKVLIVETGATGKGGSFHSLKRMVESFPILDAEITVLYIVEPKVLPEKNLKQYFVLPNTVLSKPSRLYYLLLRIFPKFSSLIYRFFHKSFYNGINCILETESFDLLICNTQPARDHFIVQFMYKRVKKIVCFIRSLNIPKFRADYTIINNIEFVAVSKNVSQRWEKYGIRKSHVIYNFLDAGDRELKENKKKEPPSVSYVGHLIERKGVEKIPEIFAKITQAVPSVQFKIVGDGPLKSGLEASLKEKGIDNYIFMGYIGSPVEEISNSHILLHPANEEPFGRVVIEAMNMETVPVASNVGGIPEILNMGECGILVEPWDIDGFADAAIELLTNESKRRDFTEKGRKRVLEVFNEDVFKRKFKDVISPK